VVAVGVGVGGRSVAVAVGGRSVAVAVGGTSVAVAVWVGVGVSDSVPDTEVIARVALGVLTGMSSPLASTMVTDKTRARRTGVIRDRKRKGFIG
jgi:hypothetical protein